MKCRYSGAKSIKFWREIKKIEDQKIHDLLYAAGCALQEHETHVLHMLEQAQEK